MRTSSPFIRSSIGVVISGIAGDLMKLGQDMNKHLALSPEERLDA